MEDEEDEEEEEEEEDAPNSTNYTGKKHDAVTSLRLPTQVSSVRASSPASSNAPQTLRDLSLPAGTGSMYNTGRVKVVRQWTPRNATWAAPVHG